MRRTETGKSGAEAEYTFFNLSTGLRLAAHVRLAGDSASRRKGLLGVDQVGRDSGLWIAPCEAIHTFGMKMPIDVLFLDRDLKVRKRIVSMPPGRISVCLVAASVVELRAGAITDSDTKVGDRLSVQRTREEDDVAPGEPMRLGSTCPSS